MIKSLLVRHSLMRRLALGFLITSIAPLAFLGWLNLQNFQSALTRTVVNNMSFIADKKVDQINDYIENSRTNVRSLSHSQEIIALFEELQRNYQKGIDSSAYKNTENRAQLLLSRIVADFNCYDLLFIDTTGEVVFSIKKENDFASNLKTGRYNNTVLASSFRESLDFLSTEFSTFDFYTPSDGKSSAFTSAPLLKNGLLIGVIAAQTNLENSLPLLMDSTGLGETGEALLAKSVNNVVMFTTPPRYIGTKDYVVSTSQLARPMRFALNGQRGQGMDIDYAGHTVVAAWRYLPSLHWGMVVKIDAQEALEPYRDLRFYSLLALSFVLSTVTFLAFFIGKSILNPVRDLIKITDEIAKGDFNQRVPTHQGEFGELARTFNHMTDEIQKGYDTLEQQVKNRTAEFLIAKENAEEAFRQLQNTQETLVQTEKMAALGGLVAGIAHEINTPVGVTLTSATHLEAKTRKISKLYEQGELDEDELSTYFTLAEKSAKLITLNSQRAADLIHSFKQVAVDQTSCEKREFDLKNYLEDILLSLQPTLKKTAIKVELDCPENLIVNIYAGAISQIITNFVMNSLHHAYEPQQSGVLSIRVTQPESNLIELIYSDDGKGIPQELQAKIFDPFFTTRRNDGGSGLGLHIVYNLVYQTLKGSLKLQSGKNSTTFTVQFPRELP